MPRYAYIPVHSNYQPSHLTTEIDEFQNRKVLKIDSTEITKEEYESLRKELKESCYCFSCDSKMKLRNIKGKHQHFAHYSRQECFEAESLAHASVKRNLYERFKKRGYKVTVERSFKSFNKQLYTDVAVMEKEDILAIEVQASPSIRLHTIAERTTTYAEAGIPTAWVIVLDSFFGEGNFTSTKEQVLVRHEDGTSSYEERPMPYSSPTPFIITTDIPKSFLFIMDQYKYVIAVNHDGHFFMIRRVEVTGDVFEIYRIEQEKVVDSLLATEIKKPPYIPDKTHEKPSHELQHNEGQHPEEEDIELEGEKILRGLGIDFERAYVEEAEQLKYDTALDILNVIEETKRREALYAKKQRLLESYNEQIIRLLDEQKYIHVIYQELKWRLSVQFEQIESWIQEKIRAKEREEEEKRKQENEIKIRLTNLENQRLEEERKSREDAEIQRKQQATEREPIKRALINLLRNIFQSKSLAILKQLSEQNITYYAYEYLRNHSLVNMDYSTFSDILDKDIHNVFHQVLVQKQKTEVERSERESKQELGEKDRLCKEIQDMQSKAGFTIVRNIQLLRKSSLKEIKESHQSVYKHYSRLSQLTLF